MADFIPVNDDHAVESVAFQFLFAQPFTPQQLTQFSASHHLWKEELPAFDQGQPFVRTGWLNGGLVSSVGFSHIRPDGTPSWQMRIDGAALTISCTRYTRWDKVWGSALTLLSMAHQATSGTSDGSEPGLKTIVLAVTDAFNTGADLGAYDVNDLLRPSKFVCDYIRTCGARWHNNLGWYEEAEGAPPVLHNLNILSAVMGDPAGAPTHVRAQIMHQLELRLEQPLDFSELDFAKAGWVDRSMIELHLSNKAVLRELLTDELANRINLDGGEARA